MKRPAPVRPVARPAPVDPKRAQATKLVRQGLEKMELGFYTQALERYRAAYKVVPSPKIFYNIALAYNYLTRYVQALDNFELFVRRFKDRNHRYWKAAKHSWIPRLKKKIATVRVVVNVPGATVTVAGRSGGVSPRTRAVRVQPEPGRFFVIVVSKPAHVEKTVKLKLKPGQILVQRVKLLTHAEALARQREFKREQLERRRVQLQLAGEKREAQRRRERRRRQLRIAGWSTVGLGIAVVLAGGALGIVSLSDKHYIESAGDGVYYSDVRDRFERNLLLSKYAWAALGTGLAVAAAGGIMIWLSYRRRETPRPKPGATAKPKVSLLPALGPSQAGLTLWLRY